MSSVSAVLFVRELVRVSSFYREVLGGKSLASSPDHDTLDCSGFRLVIHQIPASLFGTGVISSPPERRERTAIRLDFRVPDIQKAREAAKRLGGQVDDQPPPWAAGGRFYLGYDPEGNVIGFIKDA